MLGWIPAATPQGDDWTNLKYGMHDGMIITYILQTATGLMLASAICVQYQRAPEPGVEVAAVESTGGVAGLTSLPARYDSADYAELARTDPIGFLRLCRARYRFRDYTCTFVKQELMGKRVTKAQEIAVRFREEPFSVDMQWVKNADQASRALYVENAWKDRRGRELAWFKPAGALIRLIVPRIKQPILGSRAKAASRRSLDQFGFSRTLDLIIKYVEKGRRNDVLELRYVGVGDIKGRSTYVFERFLPYDGREAHYPDNLLRYHIDQEWLIPSACYSYSDREGKKLLGSYVMTDVTFDVGLGDDDFDPSKNDF